MATEKGSGGEARRPSAELFRFCFAYVEEVRYLLCVVEPLYGFWRWMALEAGGLDFAQGQGMVIR